MVVSSYLCSCTLPEQKAPFFSKKRLAYNCGEKVCDPDDFSGTATNCETKIDFKYTGQGPGNGFSHQLSNQIKD